MAGKSTHKPQAEAIDADSRLVSALGLAKVLNVPVGQIYRLASQGLLPRYRVGHRTTRYDVDEVLAVLREEPETGTTHEG